MPPINSECIGGWGRILLVQVLKMYSDFLFCFVAGSVGCRNSNRVVGVYWRIAVLVLKLNVFNNLGMRIAFASVNAIIVFLVNIAIFSKVWETAYRELRHLFAIVRRAESNLW